MHNMALHFIFSSLKSPWLALYLRIDLQSNNAHFAVCNAITTLVLDFSTCNMITLLKI